MTIEYPNVAEYQIDSPDMRSPSSMNSSGVFQNYRENGSDVSGDAGKLIRLTENEEIYNRVLHIPRLLYANILRLGT